MANQLTTPKKQVKPMVFAGEEGKPPKYTNSPPEPAPEKRVTPFCTECEECGSEIGLFEFDMDTIIEYMEAEDYRVIENSESVVSTPLTHSILDAELEEVIEELFQKYGYNLSNTLRTLL